jgi:hypothetical protein
MEGTNAKPDRITRPEARPRKQGKKIILVGLPQQLDRKL